MPPCAGTEVHQPVGAAHDRLVVLDDNHRVAAVPQAFQGGNETVVVAGVQADRRLVQDVARAYQPGTETARQADPLQLAAAERLGGAVEREVAQPDLVQELQPGNDFTGERIGDWAAVGGEFQRAEEHLGRGDVLRSRFVDRAARDPHRAGLRPQARPAAVGAGDT